MMSVMEHTPNWALFVIFLISSWILLGLFTILLKSFSGLLGLKDLDTAVLDTATQNAMAGAYVILGFVLLLVMTNISQIDSNIAQEASKIESLDRLLMMEGSAASQNARRALRIYTKSIVEDEWGRLAGGARREETRQYLDLLFHDIGQIKPANPHQEGLFQNIVSQGNDVSEYRNLRLLSATSRLPNIFWQVSCLTVLGVILIAALRLTQTSSIRVAALLTQLAMISCLFATVMILDLPYLGEVKTSPDAFLRAIEQMDRAKQ